MRIYFKKLEDTIHVTCITRREPYDSQLDRQADAIWNIFPQSGEVTWIKDRFDAEYLGGLEYHRAVYRVVGELMLITETLYDKKKL